MLPIAVCALSARCRCTQRSHQALISDRPPTRSTHSSPPLSLLPHVALKHRCSIAQSSCVCCQPPATLSSRTPNAPSQSYPRAPDFSVCLSVTRIRSSRSLHQWPQRARVTSAYGRRARTWTSMVFRCVWLPLFRVTSASSRRLLWLLFKRSPVPIVHWIAHVTLHRALWCTADADAPPFFHGPFSRSCVAKVFSLIGDCRQGHCVKNDNIGVRTK